MRAGPRVLLTESCGEAVADSGPLRGENTVEDGVALKAVGAELVRPENALAGGAEACDGALGGVVAGVGFELDAAAAEGLKAVREQEEFGGGIDLGAAGGRGQPSVTDFEGAFGGAKVEETGGADDMIV